MSIFSRLFGKRQEKRGRVINARFDAAGHNDNAAHWRAADWASADRENSAEVRRALRNRSRYEVANNSYARGMTLTLAEDCIGAGAKLQALINDRHKASEIEGAWQDWCDAVDLPGKLRLMRMAKCVDGEAFAILITDPKVKHQVKLSLKLVEADRVCDPANYDQGNIDGIELDAAGNPASYRITRQHPAGLYAFGEYGEADKYEPQYVLHYFRADRPEQHRGIPEFTPALDLFAFQRRMALATIAAAETAANIAAAVVTDQPPEGETVPLEPLDTIDIRRNSIITIPAGWKIQQFQAAQPTAGYAEFHRSILNEIARCLSIPYNIASGNSSGYNYSSAHMDNQLYHKALRVEHKIIERQILDKVFAEWWKEYSAATGMGHIDVRWIWDGWEPTDPVKAANATAKKLAAGMATFADIYAAEGKDWEEQFEQIARERQKMAELGITFDGLPETMTEEEPEEEETNGI